MSRRTARRLLLLGGVLLVPLPYLVLARGAVPPIRMAFLGTVALAYALVADGSGTAWPIAGLLLGQSLLYGALLWLPASALSRALPERLRGPTTAGLWIVGFALALALPLYHTPFAAEAAHTRWLGLLR